jgi:hypothetical protein
MNREDFQEGVGESRHDKQRKGGPCHHDPVGLVHARTLSQGPRAGLTWIKGFARKASSVGNGNGPDAPLKGCNPWRDRVTNPIRDCDVTMTGVSMKNRTVHSPRLDNGGQVASVTVRLGKIQRRIARAFIAKPGEMLTSRAGAWCYPHLTDRALNKHRFCVRQAADRVADHVDCRRPGGIVWAAKKP